MRFANPCNAPVFFIFVWATQPVVKLPTTYIKKKKSFNLKIMDQPIIHTVPSAIEKNIFLKGLNAKHTVYYLDSFPLPYPMITGQSMLEKLPTMVEKGAGLSGAIFYKAPQQKFSSALNVSTGKGISHNSCFNGKKNNHFITGSYMYDTDGKWNSIANQKYFSQTKDQNQNFEAVVQAGHEDQHKKFTITGLGQHLINDSCDITFLPPLDAQTYKRDTYLLGAEYKTKTWSAFTSLHATCEKFSNTYPSQSIQTFTAGVHKEKTDYQYGLFTQHTNNRIYRYDIYGGRKFGFFYPLVRLIQTEQQTLLPWQVIMPHDFMTITFGSVYNMPTEYQRFNSQYGNLHIKPEHNYHCHVVSRKKINNWSLQHLLFFNHVNDLIDMKPTYNAKFENLGQLTSVGIDQTISFDGWDRYKFGFSHTYCVLDSTSTLIRRPAWKAVLWQRLYAKDHVYFDLKTTWASSYLDYNRFAIVALDEKITEKNQPQQFFVKMPGVLLWDISATYEINHDWKIIFDIKNLTNKYYENPHGYKARGIEAWIRLKFDLPN